MVSAINENRTLNGKDNMKLQKEFTDYNPLFRFTHFVYRNRLYRGFDKISFLGLRIIAMLLGKMNAVKVYRKLHRIWKFLYPTDFLKDINTNKWADRFIAFNIEIYFIITFLLPAHTRHNINKFTKVHGFEHIVKALQKEKGVLIPSIHIGQPINPISFLLNQKVMINNKEQKIFMVMLSSPSKEFIFREIAKKWGNIDVVISSNFNHLQDTIRNHLKQNHVVVLMQDYYKESQMRVPFIYGSKKYDFLVPCPQMISSFYFNLGCPIIPMLSLSETDLSRSTTYFFKELNLENQKESVKDVLLKKTLKDFSNGQLSKKEKFGILTLIINKLLNPYILKYPFYWEELFLFKKRTQFKIQYPEIKSYYEFFKVTIESLKLLVENSYEPNRNDKNILLILAEIENEIQPLLLEEDDKFFLQKKFIELGRLNGHDAIEKAVSIVLSYQNEFILKNHPKIDLLFKKLLDC